MALSSGTEGKAHRFLVVCKQAQNPSAKINTGWANLPGDRLNLSSWIPRESWDFAISVLTAFGAYIAATVRTVLCRTFFVFLFVLLFVCVCVPEIPVQVPEWESSRPQSGSSVRALKRLAGHQEYMYHYSPCRVFSSHMIWEKMGVQCCLLRCLAHHSGRGEKGEPSQITFSTHRYWALWPPSGSVACENHFIKGM